MTHDYHSYYHLEDYLFDEVRPRFFRDHVLDAFDLFSILVWKANRAKSYAARRMLKRCSDLETAAGELTRALYEATTPEERFRVTVADWGFRLPTATAILSVLWPDEFTVYDVRVCDQLRRFHDLYEAPSGQVWPGYCNYREAVRQAVPEQSLLRDKDRVLWGRSAARQLVGDIAAGFPRPPTKLKLPKR